MLSLTFSIAIGATCIGWMRLPLDPAASLPASSLLHNNISSLCCHAAAPAADIATLCNLLALLSLDIHPSISLEWLQQPTKSYVSAIVVLRFRTRTARRAREQ